MIPQWHARGTIMPTSSVPYSISPFVMDSHVIQRTGRENWTRPYGLRDAGKLIEILMVLLRGGDLRMQDEARKLAVGASANGRPRRSDFGGSETERPEEARPRAWFNRKGGRTPPRGCVPLQRIKSFDNLHRSANWDESEEGNHVTAKQTEMLT